MSPFSEERGRRAGGRAVCVADWEERRGRFCEAPSLHAHRLGAAGHISYAENSLNVMVINFTRFLITARIIRSDPKVEKKVGTFSWKILLHNVDILKY